MVRRYRIGVIKGDGIGPEVVDASLRVLGELGLDLEFIEISAGYGYYKRTGKPIEDGFVDKVMEMDAVLKGPLHTPPHDPSFRSVNVLIRRTLDLYANIRPFKSYKGISQREFNFVIIRENTEGEYIGIEGVFSDMAISLRVVTERGSRRICDFAFRYAKLHGFNKVTVVHKANILKITDGLFRDVFFRVASSYPDIIADELIVDTAAYTMVKNPEKLQVLVMPNLYGDILSDLAAGLVGSLGLCGSAQIGEKIGVFEPVHGTAPDIAGKNLANPVGMIMASKMMLEYIGIKYGDQGLLDKAHLLEKAVQSILEEDRVITADIGGDKGTVDVVNAVLSKLRELMYG
ncbi:MAG: isocitrate/isopropylmalate dehydrogenase family protein [Desulfurococcaceae archaeon]